MRCLLLALALLACGGSQSRMGPAPVNVEKAPPAGADAASERVVVEWLRRMGIARPRAPLPRVRWFVGMSHPDVAGGRCCYLEYRGLAAEPVRVSSIAWPYNGAIHLVWAARPSDAEGLAHELLHFLLIASGMDGDRNHEGPFWDHVGSVQGALREAGL